MARIVVIGNAGGGKSTLSRAIASARHLPHHEVDRWLWRPGWQPTPKLSYDADHAKAIAGDAWVIDGLGRQESIAPRFARATAIVLVDMPLWTHYWLAAERQIAWAKGEVRQPPGAIDTMPPTEALFRTMWEVDQGWMPMVRELCRRSERSGATLYRLGTIAALNGFADHFAQHHPPTPAFRPAGAHCAWNATAEIPHPSSSTHSGVDLGFSHSSEIDDRGGALDRHSTRPRSAAGSGPGPLS